MKLVLIIAVTVVMVLLQSLSASAQFDPFGGGGFQQRQPPPQQNPIDNITAHPMLAGAMFQFNQQQLYQMSQNFQQMQIMTAQQQNYIAQLQQANLRYQMEMQYRNQRRGLFRR
jgi:TolA-binding protein